MARLHGRKRCTVPFSVQKRVRIQKYSILDTTAAWVFHSIFNTRFIYFLIILHAYTHFRLCRVSIRGRRDSRPNRSFDIFLFSTYSLANSVSQMELLERQRNTHDSGGIIEFARVRYPYTRVHTCVYISKCVIK